MRCFAALAVATLLGVRAAPLKCGVATKDFPDCPKCMETMVSSGMLDFWWNWDTLPKLDMTAFSPAVAAAAKKAFTPMLWGQDPPTNGYGFLDSGSKFVMGYNEPDQYGPPCAGQGTAGVFGCTGDPSDYHAATSSGWAPLFDPASAAPLWQTSINTMTSNADAKNGTVSKIAAPAMAQSATPEENCANDPSVGTNSKYCHGWMQAFKRQTMALSCTNFKGVVTNCWDIIHAIPIHAYARTAAEIKAKIQVYYTTFQDDFEGKNGRTKKTLWLTEVTMGSNDATEIAQFVDDLMNPADGLTNRAKFGFVEKVSWFSEWSFPAFKVGNYTPKKYESWSSPLFEPTTGLLTPSGQRFVSHCGGNAPPGPAPDPTPPSPTPPPPPPPPPPPRAACKVGDIVKCPGMPGQMCAGNQCCPDGSACPSAGNAFNSCSKPKKEDCTKSITFAVVV